MRSLSFVIVAFFAMLLCSCGSAPPRVTEPSLQAEQAPGPETAVPAPDYTKDWQSIAALAGEVEYSPYVTQIVWKRRNWEMTLSGEWIDDLIEDYMRLKSWRDKLKEWTAAKGNPEWEY